MKAVILCGGVGSRLRPLTETVPKPLIKVLGVPILGQIIHRLTLAGIEDVYLSLGYKAQDIISYAERLNTKIRLHYCEEAVPLGTAGGVRNCLKDVDDDILVVSGDNLFDFDLNVFLSYHKEKQSFFSIVGVNQQDPREYGTVLTDAEGRITGFCEKPTWEKTVSRLINTGVYLFGSGALQMIPEDKNYDFSNDLFPKLLKEDKPFYCFESNGFWGDVGSFSALRALTCSLLKNNAAGFLYDGVLYTEDSTDSNENRILAPCLIHPDADPGENNAIGPCTVIGKNCMLGREGVVKGSILGEDVTVGEHSDLFFMFAHDNVRIGANCVVEKDAVLGYGCVVEKFSRVLQHVKVWPGKVLQPESIIDRDMYYETPQHIEADIFGISGKMYSQFSLADAVRIGHAVASVKSMQRIGVASDGSESAGIYKTVLACGVRACGVICYDFEEIYKSQAYFFSAYCSLDAFLFVSADGDTVNVSFFGTNGMPVTDRTAYSINSNYKFSSFRFSENNDKEKLFQMHLLWPAYTAALQKTLDASLTGRKIRIECENRTLKKLFKNFLLQAGASEEDGGLQFLINDRGTEMYCVEEDRFYSSDRIRMFLCEMELSQGKRVIVPEDAPFSLESRGREYKTDVLRLYENATVRDLISPEEMLDNLWTFDAVFLCVKLLHVLIHSDMQMKDIFEHLPDITVRKKSYL